MKKNTLLVVIVLAGIIFIIVLLQLMKPNTDFIPSGDASPVSINQEFFSTAQVQSTSFTDVLYTGANIILPPTLSSLSTTVAVFPDIQENLSNYCQINAVNVSSFGTQYHRGSTCNYYLDGSTFVFFDDTDNPQIFARSNDLAQAIETLTSIITSIYGESAFTPLTPTPLVIDDAPNAFRLRFAPHYNQTPIHQHDVAETDITTVFNEGNFVQAVFPAKYLSATPQAALTTISLDQAINNISQGNAYLADYNEYNYISENSSFIDDLSNLHNIVLSSVTLEYRLNPEETLAVPSYHFSGTARDSQNNTMGVEIITPAINFTIAEPTLTPTTP